MALAAAAVALVPWPASDASMGAAEKAALKIVCAAAGVSREQAKRLGPVAAALVSEYVGAAEVPQAVLDEAAIRAVAWLKSVSLGKPESSSRIGSLTTTTDGRRIRAGALRGSGAATLLAPWRVNDGGVC